MAGGAQGRADPGVELAALPPARDRGDALRVRGRPGDDVNHAVDPVYAAQCGARAADHLDSLDVAQHQFLLVPEDAGEERRVHRAAVDEHEEVVADRVVEAARPDRVLAGVETRDLENGRQAERLRQAGRRRAADICR
jgi:hypothetical protein